jgi:hypothetical protein
MAMEAADLRKILSAISKVGSARLSYCTAEYEGTRQRKAVKASYLYLRLASFIARLISFGDTSLLKTCLLLDFCQSRTPFYRIISLFPTSQKNDSSKFQRPDNRHLALPPLTHLSRWPKSNLRRKRSMYHYRFLPTNRTWNLSLAARESV